MALAPPVYLFPRAAGARRLGPRARPELPGDSNEGGSRADYTLIATSEINPEGRRHVRRPLISLCLALLMALTAVPEVGAKKEKVPELKDWIRARCTTLPESKKPRPSSPSRRTGIERCSSIASGLAGTPTRRHWPMPGGSSSGNGYSRPIPTSPTAASRGGRPTGARSTFSTAPRRRSRATTTCGPGLVLWWRGSPLHPDPLQQCRGRLIVRVLGHQLPFEGPLQDGLAQLLRTLQVGF